MKEMLQQQGSGNNTHQQLSNSQSDDLKRAKQEAAEAQDSVKVRKQIIYYIISICVDVPEQKC